MVNSTYSYDNRFVFYECEKGFIKIEEATDKAYKSKKEVKGGLPCLENTHKKKYEKNDGTQKGRDTIYIHGLS